jgi:hypothetical protein
MPLYIRDDEVRQLANQLAQQRKCNVTEAVREALNEALGHDRAKLADRKQDIAQILSRFDQMEPIRPDLIDKALYDENGMPIL